ncbi:MAG: hypothetical protein KGM60_08525 [Comamonadaceae bacterium]|nr:hypothetical protein [Comamonadaceae bacterium]
MRGSQEPLVTQDRTSAPCGWSRQFRMSVYKPGTRVRLAGSWEEVSHISLCRNDLAVHLVGHAGPVDPSLLELEPTLFTTVRVSDHI